MAGGWREKERGGTHDDSYSTHHANSDGFNSISESAHTFDRLYSSSSKQCTRVLHLFTECTSCKFKVKS